MNKQTFFLVAVLLAFIGLIAHSVARRSTAEAMQRKTVRMVVARQQHIAYTPDPRSLQLSSRGRVLTSAGLVSTLLSVICMITALVRREPGWYLFLALLLFFDLAAPMLL